MENEPLVTINTSCYNHEKYLPDYFESIISQTYKNIELIIFDDASQDNSQKIIENYLPKLKKRFTRVVYIPRKKNIGLVKSCNKRLDLAKGKYIIGFASDDIMLPARVEENVRFLEDNPEYGMMYSDGYIFNDDIDIKTINFNNLECFSNKLEHYSGDIMNRILVSNCVNAPTACVRKTTFNSVGRYNENYCYEDFDMWLKIAEKYKIGYLNKKLVLYRVHKGSFNTRKDNKIKMLKDREKIIDAHAKNGKYDQRCINLAKFKMWEYCVNYFFTNFNRIECLEYFHKYLDLSRKGKLKLKIKMRIKYYISLNKYVYKIIWYLWYCVFYRVIWRELSICKDKGKNNFPASQN